MSVCPDLQPVPFRRSWWVLCQAGVVKLIVLVIETVAQCSSQILRGFHWTKNAEGFGGIHSREGWRFIKHELLNSPPEN